MDKADVCSQVFNYENWISGGCKNDFPKSMRHELRKLSTESKEAYSFYRNYLFKECLIYKNSSQKLESFLELLSPNESTKNYNKLIDYYGALDVKLDRYLVQRDNAFEIGMALRSSEITHQACHLYQSSYEVELILLALASFLKLKIFKKYDVQHDKFRDYSGRLQKGRIIDYISKKSGKFPFLKKCFDAAYSSKLRNTIGHNEYKIQGNKILSFDEKIEISRDELFDAIENIQNLNNYFVFFFSNHEMDRQSLHSCGFLSTVFHFEKGVLSISILQLVCFYELTQNKNWIEYVHFKIDGDSLKTDISGFNSTIGPIVDVLRETLSKAMTDRIETIEIEVLPVSPFPEVDCEEITLDCGDFYILESTQEPIIARLKVE